MKVICTAGTSVAQGVEWKGDEKAYSDGVRQRIRNLQPDRDILRLASAETNSLARLKITSNDEVALLHSETPDGRICAEEVARLVEKHFGTTAMLQEIVGLQVTDAQRFRRIGIQNLFETLNRLHDYRSDVVLNATGGFKAVVPYLTLYGLMHRLQVIYLFERSNSLITLPPVPVNFDYERLGQARHALMTLVREGAMAKEAFFNLIPGLSYDERGWYESLLEEDDQDGYVAPSTFAMLLSDTMQNRGGVAVCLSPKAKDSYEKSTGNTRKLFTHMLNSVTDPLWRKQKAHTYQTSELNVYKMARTTVRMGAFLRGDRIYVAELWSDYGEYHRDAPGTRPENYPLSSFTPWFPPQDLPSSPETDEDFSREYEDTLDALRKDRNEGMQQWEEAEKRLGAAHHEIVARDAKIIRLNAAVNDLEAKLARVNRPWWQRLLRKVLRPKNEGSSTATQKPMNVPKNSNKLVGLTRDAVEMPSHPAFPQRKNMAKLVGLLRGAVEIAAKKDGWASLSDVGIHITKQNPGFRPFKYGYVKLSELVAATQQFEVNEKTLPGGQKTIYIRAK